MPTSFALIALSPLPGPQAVSPAPPNRGGAHGWSSIQLLSNCHNAFAVSLGNFAEASQWNHLWLVWLRPARRQITLANAPHIGEVVVTVVVTF